MNAQARPLHTGKHSWVVEANYLDCDFPLDNLPLGLFRDEDGADYAIGVAIGDQVLDLGQASRQGLIVDHGALQQCVAEKSLNALFAQGNEAAARLRAQAIGLLEEGAVQRRAVEPCLRSLTGISLSVPFAVGDYTDFLASYHHAFNVGSLYRPDNPVLPNFTSMPIAYHGRASTVVTSGEPVFRPEGLFKASYDDALPTFGHTRKLDYEMEFGVFISKGNARGAAIGVDEAQTHIAGVCLLNDWSARDIQAWETQPLGPFLGKNFCTTISPWVVTMEALAPYRIALGRDSAAPPAFGYLSSPADAANGAFEIHAQVRLLTAAMAREGLPSVVISQSMLNRDSYWTFAQMIAHHTVNGCNLRTGDLLGTGTLSGPTPGTEGSLLELTRGGKQPLVLPNGEQRVFLEDGDELRLSAYCQREQGPRIGFGECAGRIVRGM